MSHYFYEYKIYNNEYNNEYTLLKWFVNSNPSHTQKIEKLTSELTKDDLDIIQQFVASGSIVQNKIDIPWLTDSSDILNI